jgi:hypothetical protein
MNLANRLLLLNPKWDSAELHLYLKKYDLRPIITNADYFCYRNEYERADKDIRALAYTMLYRGDITIGTYCKVLNYE